MTIPENIVPENVADDIERVVQGDGPFVEAEELRLRREEDIDVPSLDDPQAEEDAAAETLELQQKVSAIEESLAFDPPSVDRPILIPGDSGFWAKITGNATDGTNRWKYAFSEVHKSTAGYGGWATLSGGRSGTTSTDPARNTIEDMNTGADAHIEGNGVDPANLDPAATGSDTFSIMPCTSDNIVRIRMVTVADTDNTTEYWFSYENGVDGDCGS